ncbi:MAG: T9SS type A sorting domain-containing protein [Bacteroidota bacterium]
MKSTFTICLFAGIYLLFGSVVMPLYAQPCPKPVITANGPLTFCAGGNVRLTAPAVSQGEVSTFVGHDRDYIDGDLSVASFTEITDLTEDTSGKIYVVERLKNSIRKISTTGIVSTIAGNQVAGHVNGQGANAQFNAPAYIASDIAGNLYVTEMLSNYIRKISPSGLVTDVAVTGLDHPRGIAVDNAGNLFVADTRNFRICKITPAGQVINIAIDNRFINAEHIALATNGDVYVALNSVYSIIKVLPNGFISPYAGTGQPGSANGPALAASFRGINGLAIGDSGNLYVTDSYTVRKVSSTGFVSTVAGGADRGFNDGSYNAAEFDTPAGIIFSSSGDLLLTDIWNSRVRKISLQRAVAGYIWSNGNSAQNTLVNSSGSFTVRTITGNCTSESSDPVQVTVNPVPSVPVISVSGDLHICGDGSVTLTSSAASGNIWSNGATGNSIIVTDAGSYSVKTVLGNCTSAVSGTLPVTKAFQPHEPVINFTCNSNILSTPVLSEAYIKNYAGSGILGFADGIGTEARFWEPSGIYRAKDGNIFVADYYNNCIRKISPEGIVSTFAGSDSESGYADGNGTDARFSGPIDITGDEMGFLYVTQYRSYNIRKINPSGQVTTLLGGRNYVMCVATDGKGNVYFTEPDNFQVCKINSAGVYSIVAGGIQGYADGVGQAARFYGPTAIEADTLGNIYVADNGKIRKISANGMVNSYRNVPAISFIITDFGDMYYTNYNGVFKVNAAGIVKKIASVQLNLSTGNFEEGPVSSARLNSPFGIAKDNEGNLYISDKALNCIKKISGESIAEAFIWSNGATTPEINANVPGSYSVRIVSGGCTSASSRSVEVNTRPVPYAPVITKEIGWYLRASFGGVSYQWYKNGIAIPGETTRRTLNRGDGEYTVTMTDSFGCTTPMSAPFIITGITEEFTTESLKLVPNPSNGLFRLEGLIAGKVCEVYSMAGQMVFKGRAEPGTNLDLQHLPAGVYEVRVGVQRLRLLKE